MAAYLKEYEQAIIQLLDSGLTVTETARDLNKRGVICDAEMVRYYVKAHDLEKYIKYKSVGRKKIPTEEYFKVHRQSFNDMQYFKPLINTMIAEGYTSAECHKVLREKGWQGKRSSFIMTCANNGISWSGIPVKKRIKRYLEPHKEQVLKMYADGVEVREIYQRIAKEHNANVGILVFYNWARTFGVAKH